MAGYVDDLAAEYSRASLAVSPVRLGAGVKFKSLDALIAGVPLGTTAVGIEGVELEGAAAFVADDPKEFAAGIVQVLNCPVDFERRAEAARTRAIDAYSPTTYRERIKVIYSLDDDG